MLDHEAQVGLLQHDAQEVADRQLRHLLGDRPLPADLLGLDRRVVPRERQPGLGLQVLDHQRQRDLVELDPDGGLELPLDLHRLRGQVAQVDVVERAAEAGPVHHLQPDPHRVVGGDDLPRLLGVGQPLVDHPLLGVLELLLLAQPAVHLGHVGQGGDRRVVRVELLGVQGDGLGLLELRLLDQRVELADEPLDLGLAHLLGGPAAGDQLPGLPLVLLLPGDRVGLALHHPEHLELAVDRPHQQGGRGRLQVRRPDPVAVVDHHLHGDVGVAAAERRLGVGHHLEPLGPELLELDPPQGVGFRHEPLQFLGRSRPQGVLKHGQADFQAGRQGGNGFMRPLP